MITFLVCLALLVTAYFTYGRYLERLVGIDPAARTPCSRLYDGVDYVPLPRWRIFLIQLLNIAGLGPIFGAVLGAAYGPVAFLWITFGGIFMSAAHDFIAGVISLRHDGASLPETAGVYLGGGMKIVMRLFSAGLMILVGAVFLSQPASLVAARLDVPSLEGIAFGGFSWLLLIVLGVILVYYIAATLLPELTQESIQRWVNRMVKAGKSPKTVANAHGFLSAVLSEFRPDVKLTTRLPQKEKHEIQIPTKAEVQAIAETCRGTKYELPIMLAICLGLRASEIRGLRWSDIDGEYVNIHTAIVEGENGAAEKGPKSYSGARRVHLPAYLRDLLARTPQTDEHITTLTGHAIYCGFSRVCEKAGVPHYRFHDLRHVNASVMLEAHIPDKYSIKRMGHATNNMLKTTYQHIFKESERTYDAAIESALDDLISPDK